MSDGNVRCEAATEIDIDVVCCQLEKDHEGDHVFALFWSDPPTIEQLQEQVDRLSDELGERVAMHEEAERLLVMAQATIRSTQLVIISDAAVEAFGDAWGKQKAADDADRRTFPKPGSKRRAGLRAVANLLGGAS